MAIADLHPRHASRRWPSSTRLAIPSSRGRGNTTGDAARLAALLSGEIVALNGEKAAIASVGSPLALRAAAQDQRGILIIVGADSFSGEDWIHVDANRSRYQRDGVTVLVADEDTVGRIEGLSPNFASWIGANVWRLRAPIPLERSAVEERLAELRRWAGFDDAHVIRLAESGELPPDPPYAEWIVLLGRGDLLEL